MSRPDTMSALGSAMQGLRLRLGIEGTRRPVDEAVATVRRATIVLAHMDDEINAFGLLLRLKAVGAEMDIVILTDGAANPLTDAAVVGTRTHFECRRDELFESMKLLGISSAALPRFPDSKLVARVDEATAFLTEHLSARRPDLIVTFEPSGFNGHPDHCTAHVATRKALVASNLAAGLAFITPTPPYVYLLGSRFRAQQVTVRTLELTPAERGLKVQGCAVYASQARTIKQLMLGMSPPKFFNRFPNEWYLWLTADEAQAWSKAQG